MKGPDSNRTQLWWKKWVQSHLIPSTKSATRTKIKEGNRMAQPAVPGHQSPPNLISRATIRQQILKGAKDFLQQQGERNGLKTKINEIREKKNTIKLVIVMPTRWIIQRHKSIIQYLKNRRSPNDQYYKHTERTYVPGFILLLLQPILLTRQPQLLL